LLAGVAGEQIAIQKPLADLTLRGDTFFELLQIVAGKRTNSALQFGGKQEQQGQREMPLRGMFVVAVLFHVAEFDHSLPRLVYWPDSFNMALAMTLGSGWYWPF